MTNSPSRPRRPSRSRRTGPPCRRSCRSSDVADPAVVRLVDEVEAKVLLADRRVHPDGRVHEPEGDGSGPDRSARVLLGATGPSIYAPPVPLDTTTTLDIVVRRRDRRGRTPRPPGGPQFRVAASRSASVSRRCTRRASPSSTSTAAGRGSGCRSRPCWRVGARRRHRQQVAGCSSGSSRALDQHVAGLAVLARDRVARSRLGVGAGRRRRRRSARRRAPGGGCRTCRRRPRRSSCRRRVCLTSHG